MRVSLEWLKEYVDITLSPEELEQKLTLSTVEIEAVERGHEWHNVWIGHVLNVEPMPGSDHLSLATVDLGDAQYRVVCGAPNVAAGQKIAYAAVGSKLTDAHTGELRTLKAAKIRGHESNGMICSERELGLSDEHEGIFELPADAPVGQALSQYLGDVVLVAGAWAHRADLLSMLGFAREVAALTGKEARTPDLEYEAAAGSIEGRVGIDIDAPDLCGRYVAGIIEDVKLGPSPDWMQRRLVAAGQRPINNVVDITNYVMLEFGQPLHAFDFDRIHDHQIIVRRARQGERLTTLDGVDRELNADMLVIADPAGPVALAGVMGGAGSDVGEHTRHILLEAANFHGMNIRRTSTLLALRSEASSRFEKQLPANLAERAARRAMQLLVQYAGGRACAGFVDNYPVKQPQVRIELTAERLRKILGIEVSTRDVTAALRSLGFECEWRPPNVYAVTVPDWRTDVLIPDDVIEEVIRIIGFERLPGTTISGRVPEHLPQPQRVLRDRVKDALVAAGGQEIITYSVVSREMLEKVVPAEDLAILQPLRVVNPVSAEHELMRTTMRGNLLEALATNLKLRRPSLSLFETGVVYIPAEDRSQQPEERETLVGAIVGERLDRWGRGCGEPLDFFDAKGLIEALDVQLGAGFDYADADDPHLLRGRTAEVRFDNRAIGVIGQVHPDLLARFDIDRDVFLYELNLRELAGLAERVPQFRSIPRFPAVEQDLALLVDVAVPARDLVSAIRRSKLVTSAEVFDEYMGEGVPQGKRSLAIAVRFQSLDRTLTDADAAKEQERILRGLKHQFGAELRS